MKRIFRNNRFMVVILFIVSCVFVLAKCINRTKENVGDKTTEITNDNSGIKKISFKEFAGSAKCAGCHKNIYEDHIRTAHYRTSLPAVERNIRGSFTPGKKQVYV